MTTGTKPATTFWVVSGVALIWNLIGVYNFLAPSDPQTLKEIGRSMMDSTPWWATAAFAVAVFGGALGCVLLLLRKQLATTILMISFGGIVVQMIHAFFLADSNDIFGPGGVTMPIMILAIGAYLIWYSRSAASRGWIS